ncbi:MULTISPECIES: hypothetical protein [Stenotrophomonas]|uniref:hypothetical protein n=1 Tax=Stenotrophomonas TaxID=40323 RepID=UPI0022EB0B19|nr:MULTISPECIES: hypothetical protein [Stenotrophomonas]MDA3306126.1 hypothetical protein [Stenotrophomonas sp. PI_27]WGS59252.1 hypothetical protein IAI57_15785 [Stenotrophomonas pavanii]
MSNDNKALADVQPGRRVRLGDQAERARFEEWARTERLPLAQGKLGGYAFEVTARAWRAWQYLSAQPSPGDQGDAPPCWWIDHGTYGQITQRQDEADAAVNAGKRVVSYAARQPVGEPAAWVHEEDRERVISARQKATALRDQGASGSSVRPYSVPAYLHAPAQAVDLAEFKALYRAYVRLLESARDRILDLGGTCDPVDVMEANDVDLQAARRVLDSQAVRK